MGTLPPGQSIMTSGQYASTASAVASINALPNFSVSPGTISPLTSTCAQSVSRCFDFSGTNRMSAPIIDGSNAVDRSAACAEKNSNPLIITINPSVFYVEACARTENTGENQA